MQNSNRLEPYNTRRVLSLNHSLSDFTQVGLEQLKGAFSFNKSPEEEPHWHFKVESEEIIADLTMHHHSIYGRLRELVKNYGSYKIATIFSVVPNYKPSTQSTGSYEFAPHNVWMVKKSMMDQIEDTLKRNYNGMRVHRSRTVVDPSQPIADDDETVDEFSLVLTAEMKGVSKVDSIDKAPHEPFDTCIVTMRLEEKKPQSTIPASGAQGSIAPSSTLYNTLLPGGTVPP